MRHLRIMLLATAICVFLLAVFGVTGPLPAADDAEASFTLTPDEHGMVLKTPDGRVVFRYMTKRPADTKLTANSVCCLFPVNTPSGERAVDFAPSDHPHHRGVFLAWHSTKGKEKADFWGWGEWAPTEGRVIRNREVKLVKANPRFAVVEVRNEWMIQDEVMIREETVIVATQREKAYLIGLRFKLTPTVDVTLDQTAFGGFCAKTRKDGKAVYRDPKGPVKLADPHHLKPETNWPAARWYDRTIELESGKTIGLAVIDAPGNPPATWHNLPPIAMVNPCIVAPGSVTIKRGETLVLNYGLVVHDGPAPMDLLEKLSRQWRTPGTAFRLSAEKFKLEPGFVRLDNGQDLTGWFAARWSGEKTGEPTGWSVVDGAIHLDSRAARSHLFSEKTYSRNAIIRLQFRAARAADSGLNLHGKQFQVRDYLNSLPDTRKYAPACKPPGQWNDLELDITDAVAVIKLNGKVIEKAWKIGTDADRGLGLQREQGDFDFRRLQLKEKRPQTR